MFVWLNRILSGFIYITWVRVIYTVEGLLKAIVIAVLLLVVLMCIWDSDWIVGDLMKIKNPNLSNSKSNFAIFISLIGWIILAGIPIIAISLGAGGLGGL